MWLCAHWHGTVEFVEQRLRVQNCIVDPAKRCDLGLELAQEAKWCLDLSLRFVQVDLRSSLGSNCEVTLQHVVVHTKRRAQKRMPLEDARISVLPIFAAKYSKYIHS